MCICVQCMSEWADSCRHQRHFVCSVAVSHACMFVCACLWWNVFKSNVCMLLSWYAFYVWSWLATEKNIACFAGIRCTFPCLYIICCNTRIHTQYTLMSCSRGISGNDCHGNECSFLFSMPSLNVFCRQIYSYLASHFCSRLRLFTYIGALTVQGWIVMLSIDFVSFLFEWIFVSCLPLQLAIFLAWKWYFE